MRKSRYLLVVFYTLLLFCSKSSGLSLSPSPLSGNKHDKFQHQMNILSMAQIINAEFDEANFRINQWSLFSFANTIWRNSLLNGTLMTSVDFSKCQFISTDLSGVKCNRCKFVDTIFTKSTLDGSRFISSSFKNVHFEKSDLRRADFLFNSCENCTMDTETSKTVPSSLIKKWGFTIKVAR